MKREGVLYWITGLSGAGKTTIGNCLYYELRKQYDNVVLLDGDILKNITDDGLGYSEEDRRKRAKKYALLCKTLANQGLIVICCTIAMFDEVRQWNRENNKGYVEVFLDVPMEVLKKRDQKGMYSKFEKGKMNNLVGLDLNVEYPKSPDIVLCNDGTLTVNECVKRILEVNINYSLDFDRDVVYWNSYYKKNGCVEAPSLFAEFVGEKLVKGRKMLELGCGNGRDSIFFAGKGINVTAIDASDIAIKRLQEECNSDNLRFVCDDFVCSPIVFVEHYDYCYSRFSLHAINEKQEKEMINNVYNTLKEKGKFFIEVRSVKDELYGKGETVGRNAYKYNGHYRRFIVKEELEEQLKKSGFELEYSEEARDFAPYQDSNPPVIRIIAHKPCETI